MRAKIERRQTANSFYLTVNTAIIGGSAYLSKSNYGSAAVSIAGIMICALWIRAVVSYKSLNSAKFEVITSLENSLPVSPYSDEWAILSAEDKGTRHRPFHATEIQVPRVFMCVHASQVFTAISWCSYIICK